MFHALNPEEKQDKRSGKAKRRERMLLLQVT